MALSCAPEGPLVGGEGPWVGWAGLPVAPVVAAGPSGVSPWVVERGLKRLLEQDRDVVIHWGGGDWGDLADPPPPPQANPPPHPKPKKLSSGEK